MKKLAAFCLSAVLSASMVLSAMGETDTRIFLDPVQNTYTGRAEGEAMVKNLSFTDLAPNFWAKEAIVRGGALNMVKGYDKTYQPDTAVTNQEALAFVLRVLGEENNAQAAAVTVQNQLPAGSPLRTLWSIGYLDRARQLGLITRAQYNDALATDQTTLDPAVNFVRGASATREQVADWLVRGLETANPDAFTTTSSQQNIYNYSDWSNLSVDKVASMEKALAAGIFKGDANGQLKPKGSLTRAEMAQVLKNMDSIYNNMMGIVKKSGTIGGIKDAQVTDTNSGLLTRDFYVRTADGNIDVLRYAFAQNVSPQIGSIDMVVFKNGTVSGATVLSEGDKIEYLVSTADNTALYVQVLGEQVVAKTVSGKLQKVDDANNQITITDATGKAYNYFMVTGLKGTDDAGDAYITINGRRQALASAPIGSNVELSLKNNVVDNINYLGEVSVVTEARGIVTDNNPALGTLTYLDNKGNQVTRFYLDGNVKVTKQPYFSRDDGIGYIAQMFPHFKYNPNDTTIDQVEPGDIVFLRFSPENPENITAVSASTNYAMKYGKITQFVNNGSFTSMAVEYENKETAWFDVPHSVYMSKDGRPIKPGDIKPGDWVRLLVNQAILEPGSIVESVKEMTLEGDEHYISNIVRGQLAGMNSVQNQLLVQNAQTLGKTGWGGYQNVANYSLADRDIEYYMDGQRISLDYAMQYLKRADGEVYIALQNNYTGEKVKKVTFRSGRDELLSPDTVITADGNGSFSILSNNGTIKTDAGTIVRRHGRLTSGNAISAPDYAVVSLNGQNTAAVVDILEAPDTSAVMIARGRVISVNDGQSFKVSSMAVLNGNEWTYSPIEREFTIDYKTLFLNDGGYVANDTFLSYGEDTVANKVYNIVINGSHADLVVDAPYATKAVRGTIYQLEDGTASVKDAAYYDNKTGKWLPVSTTNNTLVINMVDNTIIAKNNSTVTPKDLAVGDKIRVMTNVLPAKPAPGDEVDAVIVLVER